MSSFGNFLSSSATCLNKSFSPSPVAADTLKISIFSFLAIFCSSLYKVSSCIASTLFATIICFLEANFSLYFFNSLFIVLKSSTGFLPSEPDTSITCSNNLVLSIWRRNCSPSPTPELAPSIIPGISAITKLSPYSVLTTPKFGSSVVKW